MNFRKFNWILITFVLFSLFLTSSVIAQDEKELIDPDIPETWFKPPQLASEVGIDKFNQSPILDKRVGEGELPKVEDRLPDDPIVLEPYQQVGEYGGTISSWDQQLDGHALGYWNSTPLAMVSPDGERMLPFYLKDWEFSNDKKDFTIFLRKGLKWSDGEPFTANDYTYWWEHYAQNDQLSPSPPESWDPPLLDVTKENDYTITFHYGAPNPLKENMLGREVTLGPAHYMKQFHPDFIGEEKAEKLADEKGLSEWSEFYSRVQEDSPGHPEYEYQRPVLGPYVVVERSETTLIAERNPYSPMIDTEGNQLPYIDEIKINLANNSEMAATKAVTGDATFAGRHLQTADIPLYKRNEEKEDYTTLLYIRSYGNEVNILPNHTVDDENLRKIFQNDLFRKALSLAINRDDINNKVYYGEAIPRQSTVTPGYRLFEEEYANAYAEYNPEKAEELLDEIGMIDVNDDDFRERPDGEPFSFTFEYCKMGPVEPTKVLELVQQKWIDIGIDVNLKMVSRELWVEHIYGNNIEMTAWTLDFMTPVGAEWVTAFYMGAGKKSGSQWCMGYKTWFDTEGESGIEPPQEIKELAEWTTTAQTAPTQEERDKAMKKILEFQAKNILTIGTVGLAPQPIIASNKLKNVPQKGLWDASSAYLRPYRPWQFYLEK